jgi:heme/copper-type cytochrome/quinol oxidase subunit 2
MILAIIFVMLTSLGISVHFSGVYLARGQKSYYGIFVLVNLLVLALGVTRIYHLTQHDEKGVRFLFWTLGFMLVQIVLALLTALIFYFLVERKRKKTRS